MDLVVRPVGTHWLAGLRLAVAVTFGPMEGVAQGTRWKEWFGVSAFRIIASNFKAKYGISLSYFVAS